MSFSRLFTKRAGLARSLGLTRIQLASLAERVELGSEAGGLDQGGLYSKVSPAYFSGLDLGEAGLVHLAWDEFSYTYKSWRKIRGLPSRGQRTWSNARGSGRALKDYKAYKGGLYSMFYSDVGPGDNLTAVGAEQVNMYWLRQWGSEWLRGSLSFSKARANSKKKKMPLTWVQQLRAL